MMTDDIPAYRVPARSRAFYQTPWFKLAAASLVVASALVWLFAFFFAPTARPLSVMWSALTLPSELRGMRFVSATEGETRIYEAGMFGFTEVGALLPGAFALSLDREGEKTYASFVDADNVYHLSVDGITTPTPLPLFGLSADQGGIAVAAMVATTAPVTTLDGETLPETLAEGYASDPSRGIVSDPSIWRVVLANPVNGTVLDIGPGFGPTFIDATHLLRLVPAGISIGDVSSTTTPPVLTKADFTQVSAPAVSPDRTHVAFRNGKAVSVYQVSTEGAELVATLPDMSRFTLGNNAVYSLEGAAIYRYALKDGAKKSRVGSLPASLSITSILP